MGLDHWWSYFQSKLPWSCNVSFFWKGLYLNKIIGVILKWKNAFGPPFTRLSIHLSKLLINFPGMIDILTTRQRNVEKVSRPRNTNKGKIYIQIICIKIFFIFLNLIFMKSWILNIFRKDLQAHLSSEWRRISISSRSSHWFYAARRLLALRIITNYYAMLWISRAAIFLWLECIRATMKNWNATKQVDQNNI